MFLKIKIGMLIDKSENLSSYYRLLPSLEFLGRGAVSQALDDFNVNEKRSTLFVCKSGRLTVATSWRETANREVTSANILKEGDFVLFLPGERYTVRPSGTTLMYILE